MPQTQSKFSSRGALALSCLRSDRQALVLIKGVDSVFPEKYVRACVYVLSCVNIIYICYVHVYVCIETKGKRT